MDKILPYKLMLDILSRHNVCYRNIPTKGLIDYDDTIYINPIYNDDCMTLYHEILHYNSDMIEETYLSEDEIEDATIKAFEGKHKKNLETFLSEYLIQYGESINEL
jgi:hypothetical protein